MSGQTWGTILAAAVTILGSWLVSRTTGRATVKAAALASTAATTVAAAAVDAEAYGRAKDIYDGSIDELNERLQRIVTDLDATRTQLGATVRELAETRQDLAAARQEISTLRRSVSQYEGRVIQLTEVLRLHNIDVPPWTLNPSDYGMLPGSIPDPGQPDRTHAVDDDPTGG